MRPIWAWLGVHSIWPEPDRMLTPTGAASRENARPAWLAGSDVSMSTTSRRFAATA